MNRGDMKLIDLLGDHVNKLLALPPFSEWEVTRSTEEDLTDGQGA